MEQFVPIDEVADFRLLPVKLLLEWTDKLGVNLDNIGNLKGGESLCKIFQKCSGAAEVQPLDAVLETLHQAIPKMAFYKAKDMGNSRYN